MRGNGLTSYVLSLYFYYQHLWVTCFTSCSSPCFSVWGWELVSVGICLCLSLCVLMSFFLCVSSTDCEDVSTVWLVPMLWSHLWARSFSSWPSFGLGIRWKETAPRLVLPDVSEQPKAWHEGMMLASFRATTTTNTLRAVLYKALRQQLTERVMYFHNLISRTEGLPCD